LVKGRASSKRSSLRFFLLVITLSIPIWLIESRGWPITAAVGIPLIAASILVYAEDGHAGTRRLFMRIFDRKRIKPKIWYVPTIFLLPAIFLLTYEVTRLTGGSEGICVNKPAKNSSAASVRSKSRLASTIFLLSARESAVTKACTASMIWSP
jgi:hypothetical protein